MPIRFLKPWMRYGLVGLLIIILAAGIGIWYIFTEKFTDTTERQADFTISADTLIHEFQKNERAANVKYSEKILTVNGIISEVESVDSSVNIKMTDTISGGYIMFAFQQQNKKEAFQLKEGERVSIKGSCSGGAYSEIMEAEFITFKRSVLVK